MARPRLRPVRGFPAAAQAPDGKQVMMLGLADARQISDKIVVTVPATQFVLPLMDGSRDLPQIITQVGRGLTLDILQSLVAQLDNAGLLEGPSFDAILAQMKADFDSAPVLPPASTANFAEMLVERNDDGSPKEPTPTDEQLADRMGQVFDQWIAKALENDDAPALTGLPKAIVAPHLDYGRGWINYAQTYGRLRIADRPDRVIVLGTNHFGEATGICGCDKGYRTAMGTCEIDQDLVAALRRRLGEPASTKLFANRYDHEREHSVELHIPWIQHVFGKDDQGRYPRVFGALIHDPAMKNGESYDGQGLDLQPFVEALKAAIGELPGKTLVVASADLSHAGPAFGDQETLAGDEEAPKAARDRIFSHDRDMLRLVAENRPWELVSAMAWQQNPTRWCSTGNLVAALLVTQPSEVRLYNYSAAMDQQGTTMVSSVAMVMN
jgi:predicted class III extradiol MEMO1 family dioxygenase